MKNLAELPDVRGKTVFVRADFNVPVVDGIVVDDFRIKKSFATIDDLLSRGARIILASHIEGGGATLKPVWEVLRQKYPVTFVETYYPEIPLSITDALSEGNIVLLENLRVYKEEKENDEIFSKHLASFADYYVNEAFPSSHRAHASVVGVPKYIPGFAGLVLEDEVRELSKVFHPARPFLFILGGAKFETKLPLIEKFFQSADTVFIGGALANDFLRAKGVAMGKSLLSKETFDLEKYLNEKLVIPEDVIVEGEGGTLTKYTGDILPSETISDVGPQTIDTVRSLINNAACILWNGPLGNYEKGFKDATLELARAIAGSKAISIVGGGDTVASIAELNLAEKFTFISTGGGAMLDFLANETLPGIEALEASAK